MTSRPGHRRLRQQGPGRRASNARQARSQAVEFSSVTVERATPVVRVDPERPAAPAVERAAAILRDGGIVGLPTETVYGLAGDAWAEAAVRRIFEAKQRPA
ncbi:MAG: hypothetical protein GEV09_27435, partial [Pseudonocardiaceae bacterium]|nr:hypothetical protein [Pseudonocardiaceae bacterium]